MSNETITQSKTEIFTTKSMVLTALFAAILCILAPISLPIGPVPMSLASFVIYISVYVLGWKRSAVMCAVYLLIGLVGLPVFSGFEGGVGKLAGPTGGYLIGYIFLAVVCGLFVDLFVADKIQNRVIHFIGMIVGTAVLYVFGTAWFCMSTRMGVVAALSVCVFPFIVGDLVKMLISVSVGPTLRTLVKKI